MIEKANTTNETIPCLRRGCPGIEPGTKHQPSLTASMCVVVDLPETPKGAES